MCVIVTLFLLACFSPLSANDSIAPDVWYQHRVTQNPKQSIHLITVDTQQAKITFATAHDRCASSEKTSDIAKRYNAVAVINGGFFDFGCNNKFHEYLLKALDCLGYSWYNAFPVYTLQKKSMQYAMSDRFTGAVGWDEKTQVPVFGVVKTSCRLRIGDREHTVYELNKPHQKKPTLYTSCYDTLTPNYAEPHDEIMIQDNRVIGIYTVSYGQTEIPQNGCVYAIPQAYRQLTDTIKEGDTASCSVEHLLRDDCRHSELAQKEYIVASTPLLMVDNEIVADLQEPTSPFYIKKHPRTAVGVLGNGYWVFVVVEGRQKKSDGFTICELAAYMQELGCVAALNLDGGGSSTVVVRNRLVNRPCGREYSLFCQERPISNAFLILAQEERDSSPIN